MAKITKEFKRPGKGKGKEALNLEDQNIIEFAEQTLKLKLYPAQKIILKSQYGMSLGYRERQVYKRLTGLNRVFEKAQPKIEGCWVLSRSGKSFLASIVALYEATRPKWRKYLQEGENAYVTVIATRLQQAVSIIQENCSRMLERSTIGDMVEDVTQTEITLNNGMRILSLPCNSTAGRGIPIIALIFDECGHWYTEGPRADETIFNGLRPRMSQFQGAKTLLISTPSAKQGLLWSFFEEGFEVPGRLTVQAPTLFMNPHVDKTFLKREERRDIDNYQREFEAQFCETMDSFFPPVQLDAAFTLATDLIPGSAHYCASIDQSGLSGRDAFGFSVAHMDDNGKVFCDVARSWMTEDGDAILAEVKEFCQRYGINTISHDKYAGGWIRHALSKIGLQSTVRPSLPEIYVNTKSLVLQGRLNLPDNSELRDGLANAGAFYGRNNALSIGHDRTSRGHADMADAVVSAIFEASGEEERDLRVRMLQTSPLPRGTELDEDGYEWKILQDYDDPDDEIGWTIPDEKRHFFR